MKKFIIYLILIIIISVFTIFGCADRNKDTADLEETKVRPVKVIEVKEEVLPKTLDYIGIVDANEMRRISFEKSGKVSKVNVEKGQSIIPGTILAQLDTEDWQLALKSSENNFLKAQQSYDLAKNNFSKTEVLYNSGAISEKEYDYAKLELDNLKKDLENAKVDVENKKNILTSCILKSNIEGYVVDVLIKQGEVVDAGYPVVVVRDNKTAINVGVTQDDITKVKEGLPVKIYVNQNISNGTIKEISQVPEQHSRTYNIKVELENENLQIGSIVNVKVNIGKEQGVLIPIPAILSNGQDYVYIVQGDKAFKKPIEIVSIRDNKVLVKGIKNGDKLVTEGMKKLTNGEPVIIQ